MVARRVAVLALFALAGCAGEKAEGRPWIHDIRFLGLHSVSKRDLKSKLAIQKTSWAPLSPKRYLDPYALPGDRERIEAYYRAHGYFDAHVVDAKVITRQSKKPSVDIEFKIVEGAPSKIGTMDVRGVEQAGLDVTRERKQLPIAPGQTFVHDRYLESKEHLRERMRLRGYAWARVHGEADVDRDAHTVGVTLDAAPGWRTHFGTVTVDGNDKVRAIDIIRTADLTTGRWTSPEEVETARGRVYNIGVFNSVRLELEHDPADPTIANVKIHVQEGQFHELRLGGGITIESQRNDVHLFAQYTKRNFLGGLRTFRARLEPAFVVVPAIWSVSRYGPAATSEAEFKQPFLFGVRHLALRAVVGYELGIDYAFQYHGPRSTLGLEQGFWRNRVQLGLSYNFMLLLFFATDPAILSNPMLAGSLYGYTSPYRVAWWQEDVALDLRDRPLDTHKGAYFRVTAEQGGIYTGSAFSYEKLLPEARFYAPMGSHVTFAARVQFGQMWSQGDLGTPITRRFYLGGPNSHRGFNYNRLAYQVPSGFPASQNVPPLPIGGDQMLLLSGELRVRIVKLFGNYLGAVAFADGGDVTLPRCNGPCPDTLMGALTRLDFAQLHWAVGGGLRYHTVIGTVRFDVGVRLNRLESTPTLPTPDPGQRIAYHLSVGEAF